MRRPIRRAGLTHLARRAVFHVDGRALGAVITADRDGYTAESTDWPELWSFAPTLDAALADLSRLVSARLGTDGPPPTGHPDPLDRRPDLRARFSRVVARVLARPIDTTAIRPGQARGADEDAAEAS